MCGRFLDLLLHLALGVEHAVGGAQHDELRAAVQLMADLLLLFIVEGFDEFGCQHVVGLQPVVLLSELALDGLGLAFAIAFR